MAYVYERWSAKVEWDVHRNVCLHRGKKSRVLLVCMFLMIEDGGGRLGSMHMYIKARKITEQCLTVGTLEAYAGEHAKVYRIYIRIQIPPPIAAQHGTHRMFCLVPATIPTAWSYTTVFLLPCFSASLLLTTSIFGALAKTEDSREGRSSHPVWEMLFSRAKSNPNILKSGFTQKKWKPPSEYLRKSL